MKTIARFVLSCTALALAAPALAHHSAAAYDTQKQVKVSGTVVQYRFANPHVYLTLQVKKTTAPAPRWKSRPEPHRS